MSRTAARSLLVVVALAAALPARAAEPALVAVLPLSEPPGVTTKVDATAKTLLEEAIRSVAGENLSPRGYTVLTGDNTLKLLADNGVDASKACEASCALEAARELKARLLISGTLAFSEGWFTAFVRLFDSNTGRQLGSVELEGQSVREVRKSFAEKAPALFARLDGGGAAMRSLPAPVPEPAPAPVRGAPAPVRVPEPVALPEPAPAPAPEPAPEQRPAPAPVAAGKRHQLVVGTGIDTGLLGFNYEYRSGRLGFFAGLTYLPFDAGVAFAQMAFGSRFRRTPEKSTIYAAGSLIGASLGDDTSSLTNGAFAVSAGYEFLFGFFSARAGIGYVMWSGVESSDRVVRTPAKSGVVPDLSLGIAF